jgi:hypothetical protein
MVEISRCSKASRSESVEVTYPPAQKASPSPVITMTRTSSSASAARTAEAMSRSISGGKAFGFPGLENVGIRVCSC